MEGLFCFPSLVTPKRLHEKTLFSAFLFIGSYVVCAKQFIRQPQRQHVYVRIEDQRGRSPRLYLTDLCKVSETNLHTLVDLFRYELPACFPVIASL